MDTHVISSEASWSPDTALQCPAHLACIAGPDLGAVVPIRTGVVLGRASGLEAPDVSRVHARIHSVQTRRGLGTIVDAGSLNGTTVIRHCIRHVLWSDEADTPVSRWGLTRQTSTQYVLKNHDQVIVGSDVFEVRLRPLQLQWPHSAPAQTRRFWFVFPMIATLAFVVWRILSTWAHVKLEMIVTVMGTLLVVALVVWGLLRHRRNRRWSTKDGAFLQLVVNSLPRMHNKQQRNSPPIGGGINSNVEVWPAMPSRHPGYEIAVQHTPDFSLKNSSSIRQRHTERQCERPAFIGVEARNNARWWAMQIATRVGGAVVCCPQRSPVMVGTPAVEIHLVWGDHCLSCTSSNQRVSDTTGQASDSPRNTQILEPVAHDPAPDDRFPAVFTDSDHTTRLRLPLLHVAAAETVEQVPTWCDQIFTSYPLVSETWWNQIVRPMPQEHSALPTSVLLADLVADTALQHVGDASGNTGNLRVPIGRNTQGVVWFDLVKDGPHALVAGTTGCGKSQALLTWLLTLCLTYSPTQLRLVLLDFKGGATFAALASVPHVDTVLTDFDPAATNRALRGIKALLMQRERQLAQLGFPDMTHWQQASEEGKAEVPPPRIVVVVDEFRVLSESHPQSLDTLIRLAAQGRSLGLHVVVSTQRPSGSVSAAMRANIEARLALRCTNVADSVDIIGDSAASELPRIPGRAILAGLGEVQLAWAPDAESWVKRIKERWTWSGPPLWTRALPDQLTWDMVEDIADSTKKAEPAIFVPTSSPRIPIGWADGIDQGSHEPFFYDGGHLGIQAPRPCMSMAGSAALSIASHIAARRQIPFHVIAQDPLEDLCADSLLSPEDTEAVSLLLEDVRNHGPAVVAIQDWETLMRHLENRVGAGHAHALWSSLMEQTSATVTIVAASAIGGKTMDWAHIRLVHCVEAEQAIRAGLKSTAVCEPIDGRFLAIRQQETLTIQIPLIPYSYAEQSQEGQHPCPHWHVATSDTSTHPLHSGTVSFPNGSKEPVLLVGADWHQLEVKAHQRWLVISDQPELWLEALDHAYLASGLTCPQRTDLATLSAQGDYRDHASSYSIQGVRDNDGTARSLFLSPGVQQAACVSVLGLRQWSAASQVSGCSILLAPAIPTIVRALLPWNAPAFAHAIRPDTARGLLIYDTHVDRTKLGLPS